MVSTADIMIYNKDFGAQSQSLKTYPAELKMVGGVVSFKPTAKLVVAGTSNISSINWAYTNSSTITTSTITTPPNTKEIVVSALVNSVRSTGASGTWFNRTSNIQIQLLVGGTWYNTGTPTTINHTNLTQNTAIISSGEITPSSHTYRVVATFTDTGGTFATPVDWIYFTETVANYSTVRVEASSFNGINNESLQNDVTLSYSLKTWRGIII